MFLRRLGQNNRHLCMSGHHCPQVLEMEGGDFAVVGMDIRAEAVKAMPAGPGVGPGETVVRVPRSVFVEALPELAAALK